MDIVKERLEVMVADFLEVLKTDEVPDGARFSHREDFSYNGMEFTLRSPSGRRQIDYVGSSICNDYKIDDDGCVYYEHGFPAELGEAGEKVVLRRYLDDPNEIGRLLQQAAKRNYHGTPFARYADDLRGAMVSIPSQQVEFETHGGEKFAKIALVDLLDEKAGQRHVVNFGRQFFGDPDTLSVVTLEQTGMKFEGIRIAGQYYVDTFASQQYEKGKLLDAKNKVQLKQMGVKLVAIVVPFLQQKGFEYAVPE